MLRPQDNRARETHSLNGIWDFTFDTEEVGREQQWWLAELPGARPMPVPASYNDIIPSDPARDHIGEVWYQRVVRVPRSWDNSRIVLRFDSATHRTTVWVNEREVMSHEGGYTPFEAVLDVVPGELIRITAAVDNRLSWQSIPPGVIEDTPTGPQ